MVKQIRSPLVQVECPNCGAPVPQLNAGTQALVCSTCGTHFSIGTEQPEVLGKGRKLPPSPRPIKIGDVATIANKDYTILGRVMYRGQSEGESFSWNEWMLGAMDGRILWLSLDEKGFALFRKLRFRAPFNPQRDFRVQVDADKQAFIHERYPAQIVGAEGELSWRAKPGDRVFVAEGAGSGLKYSIQSTRKELEVYEGREIDERSLASAFGNAEWLAMVENYKKWASTYKTAAIACVIACVIGLLGAMFVSGSGSIIEEDEIELTRRDQDEDITIELENARPVIIQIELQDSLPENSFIDIDVSIESPDGTEQDLFVQELWHETGRDEDGFWRETKYRTSEMFVPLQAGEHELVFSYDGTVLDEFDLEVSVRADHIMPVWFFIYAGIAAVGAVIFWLQAAGQRPPS